MTQFFVVHQDSHDILIPAHRDRSLCRSCYIYMRREDNGELNCWELLIPCFKVPHSSKIIYIMRPLTLLACLPECLEGGYILRLNFEDICPL